VARHPIRNTYQHVLGRCTNPRNARWPDYGARGITICDRWLGPDGFANFVADMGPKPTPRHSIDRINNDGPYAPDNCRWATASQQTRNSRHAHVIEAGGVRQHLRDWAREKGMLESTLCNRLLRSGWDPERAVNAPVDVHITRGITRVDLTGQRFGRLVVLEFAEGKVRHGKKCVALWRVRCDCGVVKVIAGHTMKKLPYPVRTCGSSECRRAYKQTRQEEAHATDPSRTPTPA
jgi:hypothetical protein